MNDDDDDDDDGNGHWSRLAALFEHAVALVPDDQIALLSRLQGEDPAMASELSRLLRAAERMGNFLEAPASPPPCTEESVDRPDPLLNRTIGAVRLERLIDRGGSGSVYAGRHLHTDRAVAVKVLRPSRASASFARRLEREAKFLARLDHPGIARLLDSGVFDLGDGAQPYIVMELIDGVPLHRFCAEASPEPAVCIDLLIRIARAVQHAHERGILHRDLKPGNILVVQGPDRTHDIKVLDFGLSRLADSGGEGSIAASLTGSQDIVGTLRYMSPEQLDGDATVRSDLYALGVLGFEMLTGRLPYPHACAREDRLSDLDLLQSIRAPQRDRLSSVNARFGAGLSAVFGTALAADPAQRYASVAAFQHDLEAWRDGRPLSVRPPTRWQELSALARRHRTLAVTAAMFMLLLLGGIAATAWQASRARSAQAVAEVRFAEVRGLARSVIFEIEPAMARVPGSTAARHVLVDRAIEYLERLEESAIDDPDFILELSQAWERIARVLGDPNHMNLGRIDEASDGYRRALELLEQLPPSQERARKLHRTRLIASIMDTGNQIFVSDEVHRSRHPRALETIRDLEALHRASPDTESALQLAGLLARQAVANSRYGAPEMARIYLERCRGVLAEVGHPHCIPGEDVIRYAQSLLRLGIACTWNELDPAAAERDALDCLDLLDHADLRDVPPMLPLRVRMQMESILGTALGALGRHAEAIEAYTRVIDMAESILQREPDDFTTGRSAEVYHDFRSGVWQTMARDEGLAIDERITLYDRAIADMEESQRRWAIRAAEGRYNDVERHYPVTRADLLETMRGERDELAVEH